MENSRDETETVSPSVRPRESGLARVAFRVACVSGVLTVMVFIAEVVLLPVYMFWWSVLPNLGLACVVLLLLGAALGLAAVVRILLSRRSRSGLDKSAAAVVISLAAFTLATVIQVQAPMIHPRWTAYHAVCLSNLKQIGLAVHTYSKENGDRYPHADRWVDETLPYSKDMKVYICPEVDGEISYAFNDRLDNLPRGDVTSPAETVMLFESVPGKNRHGGPELLPKKPRHSDGYNIVFADNHAKWVSEARIRTLKWEP